MPKQSEPQSLDRDYLTIKQAAAYLQVHPATIREHIKAGRLPASQLVPRGSIRIPSVAIEKLLERSRA